MLVKTQAVGAPFALETERWAEAAKDVWYERSKRALDLSIAVTALVLLLPALLLVALIIKLSSPGPIFFSQTRVGRGGREFKCYKFRSMVAHAEAMKPELQRLSHHQDPRTFKIPQDPRITPLGSILRKTSVDEIPQLWNVVRGEMSIVGPRPPVPSEVALYTKRDRRRLEVRPGLTCLWQISGRGNLPFDEQVRLDLEYIRNRNLLLDLKVIVLTVPAILTAKGAY
jgi:lipopolysaccharide/colanic/teichoic acid biosynthesis glycosyltransferase